MIYKIGHRISILLNVQRKQNKKVLILRLFAPEGLSKFMTALPRGQQR